MGTTMNRSAYVSIVAEDLLWLMKQERTLERDHIEAVLRDSIVRFDLTDDADRLRRERDEAVVLLREAIDNICGRFSGPGMGGRSLIARSKAFLAGKPEPEEE